MGFVWSKIEGTGLDGVYSIYQGSLFSQKDTYAYDLVSLVHFAKDVRTEQLFANLVGFPY